MKKLIMLAMVLLIWVVYMKDGQVYFAKKVETGRFQWVTITLTDYLGGTKIILPREDVKSIEETKD